MEQASPLSSPGKTTEQRSVEVSSRSSSVLQGTEMYQAKVQARQARLQAQTFRTRIESVRKKEQEIVKTLQKIAAEEEFHLQMLAEKAERERARLRWKEEQSVRTFELRNKLQTERQTAILRRKTALNTVLTQRQGAVSEERYNRIERDAALRQIKEQERAMKRIIKQEVAEKEKEAQFKHKTSKVSSVMLVQEAYAQQVELQRKQRLEALQEAEALKQKAREAMEQFHSLSLDKTLERGRKKTASPILVTAHRTLA